MRTNRSLKLFGLVALALVSVVGVIAAAQPDLMVAAFHTLVAHPSGLLMANLAVPAIIKRGSVQRGVDEAYEIKGDDDEGAPALVEIKRLITAQGTAWDAFKKTNDELIKAKADGKSVESLEAKLDKVAKELDTIAEVKQQFDDLMLKLARPGGLGGSSEKSEALAVETKTFNDHRRAEAQRKGQPVGADVTTDELMLYKSAFVKFVRGGEKQLNDDERKAMSAGSDPDGGYLLPPTTVGRMVKKLYEMSVMRRLATVQPISTEAIEGIIDNGEAEAGWVGETQDRPETGTPQVGKWRIEAGEMYAQPKVTQKLIDDAAVDIEAWLGDKVGSRFARLESAAFWLGNGVNKPRGLAMYPTVATSDDTRAWGQFEHVLTGADAGFHATVKADVLFDLIGKFRSEYLQLAQWCMRREVRTLIRKMRGATSDLYLWEPSMQAGVPDKLLGYPVNIDQYMPAVAADSLSVAFGDFAEAYTIVDRIGIRTLRDPYTSKPYVKFYSTKRTGGGAINFEAVKFLKFGD